MGDRRIHLLYPLVVLMQVQLAGADGRMKP